MVKLDRSPSAARAWWILRALRTAWRPPL